ncbi:MAG: hypothetical protein AAGD14_00835 [Planctomycetota bacterium]
MADRRDPRDMRILLGLGLDEDPDGHTHITKGDDFALLGGSRETHETMQEQVERFQHSLKKLGTNLQHATEAEVREALDRMKHS